MTAAMILIYLCVLAAAGSLALPPVMSPVRVSVRCRSRRRQ